MTKNESWKLASKSWRGSASKMMNAAAARELMRSLGRLSAQPPRTMVIITDARMAEDSQPVAAV